MSSIEEVKQEYETLKNRLHELAKIIKKQRDKDYIKKEEHCITCEYCNVKMYKMKWKIHEKTKTHRLNVLESQKAEN
ncbi:MAG: hypothetical protein ABWZ79_05855 [Pedobacter agri]